MSKVRATIVVLTFNGAEYLGDLLTAVTVQETDYKYEILVIDSGSRDDTLNIVAAFPEVRLHQIPNSEFGHGKTRNLAIEMAKGEFVVFLTQDAVPTTSQWLNEMIKPFNISKDVVAVLGKQTPRPDCCPSVKREIISVFASFGPNHSIMLNQQNSLMSHQASKDALTFYSDVNSALRKSVHKAIPYRDVNYAEDQAFGIDVIEAGLIKAYAPLGEVAHSHNYSLFKYFRRKYDEANGLAAATGQKQQVGLKELVVGSVKTALLDIRFTLRDQQYSTGQKLGWLITAPWYGFAQRLSTRLAHSKGSGRWQRLLSLEDRQRNKSTKS